MFSGDYSILPSLSESLTLRYWYSPILQSQLGISISLTENKTKSDLNEIELYFFLTLSESY